MKSYPIILLSLFSFLFFSCNDDLTDLGVGIRPLSDSISIGTDTFHLSTRCLPEYSIISRPDSFLLGGFYDEKFGSLQADILAQLQGPIDVNFPDVPNAIADSAILYLYCRSWFGDSYSPMEVNIYEMNKKTFDYSTLYHTNLDPNVYTDHSILLGHKIFTAKDATKTRSDSTSIKFTLSDNFRDRLKILTATRFTTDTAFLNKFKGIYITANYGASTLLNVSSIDLRYYYHYTYKKPGSEILDTVKNIVHFPANSEVRQVNRFVRTNPQTIIDKIDNSVNYISSPANIQTQVILPLKRMQNSINKLIQGKKQTVNAALLKVEVTDVDVRLMPQPIVQYMLLVKESAQERFFKNNELPSDTCAILAPYSASLITNTSLYERYYSFNLAKLVANELKNNKIGSDNLPMRLVPVRVKFNSSNVITSVKPQYLMSAVVVRSGTNATSPMKINMLYSGF